MSRRDFEALVRAVAAEARGESSQAWEAVAQTIINYARIQDIHLRSNLIERWLGDTVEAVAGRPVIEGWRPVR